MARKSLTKKTRFEVFKRDSFTCQYCGRMAPDVILEVDHINPVANGGENELINLVTSCYDCNRGKGKRKLSDKDEIKKQQELLKELNQKREQLEMMLKWRDSLNDFDNDQVNEVEKRFLTLTNADFTQSGKETVKRWIKKYGLIEVLDCLDISVEQYFYGNDTVPKTFSYIPKIAEGRIRQKKNPYLYKQNYIKAILRNRGMLYNENRVTKFLNKELIDEDSFDEIKDFASTCKNWSNFWEIVSEVMGGDY